MTEISINELALVGAQARELIKKAVMPKAVEAAIKDTCRDRRANFHSTMTCQTNNYSLSHWYLANNRFTLTPISYLIKRTAPMVKCYTYRRDVRYIT